MRRNASRKSSDRTPAFPRSKPRILGYVRVSSDLQVDEGHSLGSQVQMIEDWCRHQFTDGNYLLEIERDEGRSGSLPYTPPKPGSKRYRPGLGRAVEKLRSGEVDYFVVYRQNRIYRDHLQQLMFRKEFFDEGSPCRLITLAENIDASTLPGELTLNMLGALADYERKQISQNIKHANASRRRVGLPTGQVPYGWRRTKNRPDGRSGIEPYPDELKWVRRCFDLSLAGWGLCKIARQLEREGAPPPGFKAAGWDELKVHRMLQQPIHAGLIWDGDETRQGAHFDERIIEPSEFERVQEGLRARARERTPLTGKELLPLYNLGFCGTCGQRLRVVDADGILAYRCAGSASHGDVLPPSDPADSSRVVESRTEGAPGNWCPGWQKAAAPVDDTLLRLLSETVRLPGFRDLADDAACSLLLEQGREELEQQRTRAQAGLNEVRKRLDRLTDLYVEDRLAKDAYLQRHEQLFAQQQETEAELRRLEQRLSSRQTEEALLSRMRETLTDLPRIWEVLNPEERRQLVRELTDWVVLERTTYRNARLRVKVCFLAEKSAELPHMHSLDAGYRDGVGGLTPRELALLYWVREGRGIKQIAAHWDADATGVYRMARKIQKRLHVDTTEDAAQLASDRIDAERDSLPLDEASKTGLQSWRHSQEDRIRQVFEGYLRGLDRKAIAAEMSCALPTVRTYEWKGTKQYGATTLAEALERHRKASGSAEPARPSRRRKKTAGA